MTHRAVPMAPSKRMTRFVVLSIAGLAIVAALACSASSSPSSLYGGSRQRPRRRLLLGDEHGRGHFGGDELERLAFIEWRRRARRRAELGPRRRFGGRRLQRFERVRSSRVHRLRAVRRRPRRRDLPQRGDGDLRQERGDVPLRFAGRLRDRRVVLRIVQPLEFDSHDRLPRGLLPGGRAPLRHGQPVPALQDHAGVRERHLHQARVQWELGPVLLSEHLLHRVVTRGRPGTPAVRRPTVGISRSFARSR